MTQVRDKKDIPLLQTAEYYSSSEYPELVDYATKQLNSMWLHTDPNVPADEHSFKSELSVPEVAGVVQVLKLIVQYELDLGNNFWAKIPSVLPRAEVQRMCSTFANMEVAVHSPFYAEVNKLMGNDTPEFYLAYKKDPVLVDRMAFITKHCRLHQDSTVEEILLSFATLAYMEGAVLYSLFAYLKSFQTNGFNKVPSVVTGVDYVVIDEELHLKGASLLFQMLLRQAEFTESELSVLLTKVRKLGIGVAEHEEAIISLIFKGGEVPSINSENLKYFMQSRVDLVNQNLLGDAIYIPTNTIVADSFYKNIQSPTIVDYFVRTNTAYSRHWNKSKLAW